MKRILVIVLVLLVGSAAVLMASGTTESGAPPKGPVTVEVWTGASVSEAPAPPADWVGYTTIKEKLGIELKTVMLPSNFNDQDLKINTAAAANQLPDHFLVNRDPWVKLVQQGLLADVSDMLPLMPERTKQQYTDPVGKKVATANGKLYALPSPGAIPKVEGVVIRKDWLDKLGLQVPKTLDDFFAVAKAFTEKDPDGNGKNDTYGFGGYLDQHGLGPRFDFIVGAFTKPGVWNIDEASFGLTVRDPAYGEALSFMKKIIDAGVIDPDWATLKKDDFRARWKQGKFGIMREQFAALAAQSNYAPFDKNFPEGQWIAIAPPTGPKGLSAQGTEQPGYRLMAVSKKAEQAGKKPAIAKLLEWMSTDGYYLFGFGVEGQNYVKAADGSISVEGIAKDQQYSSPAGQVLTQFRNMVFYNSDVELKARYPYYKTANGRTIGPLQFLGEFKKYPYYDSPGIAIIDPPASAADFYRFYDENIIKFVMGQTPINADTLKAFNDGLDKLGAKEWEAASKKKLTANFMLN